jgi:carbon-monoxide dehydrogenase medium subunit
MKPASFRYYRARSLQDAVRLLGSSTGGGKLLAGGQSLIPLMNLRLARPETLIDLNFIPDWSYIRIEDNEIALGALTRHREMEFSSLLARELPIFSVVIPHIGHPAIRNRGTLGGSVAHADPAAELPCLLTALDAMIVAAGPDGERTVRAEEFFCGYYATALSEQEIVKEVRVPLRRRPAGWSFLEFARRHGDFALAEVSVVLYAAATKCVGARVVVGGGVEKPLRLISVERLIQEEMRLGIEPGPLVRILQQAAQLTETALRDALDKEHSRYLSHLTGVLVRRAVADAVERWKSQ